MRRATRIASWALALYALFFAVQLVRAIQMLGWPGLLAVALFALAAAALWAVWRVNGVLRGDRRRADLWIAGGLGLAALGFANATLREAQLLAALDQVGEPHRVWPLIFLTGLPALLAAWVGAVFLMSGLRAFRARLARGQGAP